MTTIPYIERKRKAANQMLYLADSFVIVVIIDVIWYPG